MKKIGIMALVAVAVVATFSSVASAGEDEFIGDFKVVDDFPSLMVAGSAYQARYIFKNLSQEIVSVQVCFKVGHPLVGRGEWSVWINGTDVGEIEAGVFWSGIYDVGTRGQVEFTVDVSSPPNILPATYTFTVELWSGEVRIYPPEKLPSGWIVVTDALSSEQNWQVVFVAVIGVLGVATMLCIKSFTSGAKKPKKTE